MNNSSDRNTIHHWISEDIIIGVSPVIGYLLVFLYELGYAHQFKIPSELIVISIKNIFFAIGWLWTVAIFFIGLAISILPIMPAQYGFIWRRIFEIFHLFFIFAQVMIYGSLWKE